MPNRITGDSWRSIRKSWLSFYARFTYSIIHILRMTAMIEPMAQSAVHPSIHVFAQYCSMRGRAKARHAASQGSSEMSISESNEDTSMCPLSLKIFANLQGDIYAPSAAPDNTVQETSSGEQDDTARFYARFPHLGDFVPRPSSINTEY